MGPWFVITQKGRTMTIEWRIPTVTSLSSFIYWAWKFYDVEYQILAHRTKKGIVELVSNIGTAGEYQRGLFCGLPSTSSTTRPNFPYRTNIGSTHKLLQHGLDGLPDVFYRQLFYERRDNQLFLVTTKQLGTFTLSPAEWSRLLSRGEDGPLHKLAIEVVSK